MKRIVRLQKTIKSNSHNSCFTEELGNHWPAGQRFKRLSKASQTYCGKIAYEQIGGEEVIVLVPYKQIHELFGYGTL